MSDILQVGLEGIIERLSGELATAQAEIERLKAALREIHHATSFTMLATNHGKRGDIAFEIADAALEGKP